MDSGSATTWKPGIGGSGNCHTIPIRNTRSSRTFCTASSTHVSRLFFAPEAESLIRLDEIDWGGVAVNGIPPLEYPAYLAADEAAYLDDDIVFGIAAGGETRAYPKRILAWHEMALDRLGGTELTVVYCTLCGTVIPPGTRASSTVATSHSAPVGCCTVQTS